MGLSRNRAAFLVPPRTRGPRGQAGYPNLAGPPRPRGNESFAVISSLPNATTYPKATTPAKAGAQLGNAPLADAALPYLDLSNWAPASAGVVLMDGRNL
ncbi:hypothetical protein HMP09_1453 [Sphingomonas sp. HMP9]|nr:hypothetical protein HMP09_1453 [Sphingomonas sp. HMP9]